VKVRQKLVWLAAKSNIAFATRKVLDAA